MGCEGLSQTVSELARLSMVRDSPTALDKSSPSFISTTLSILIGPMTSCPTAGVRAQLVSRILGTPRYLGPVCMRRGGAAHVSVFDCRDHRSRSRANIRQRSSTFGARPAKKGGRTLRLQEGLQSRKVGIVFSPAPLLARAVATENLKDGRYTVTRYPAVSAEAAQPALLTAGILRSQADGSRARRKKEKRKAF